MLRAARRALPAALLLLAAAAPAHAQVFLAARPSPELLVAPLFVRASVSPDAPLGDAPVEILFSLAIPPARSALDFEQEIALLWPGAVAGGEPGARPDPALARRLGALGLAVVAEGRLPLAAQRHYEAAADPEPVAGGAPFATFVRRGGPLGESAPATLIRIPWTPKLVNRAWLMDLRFTARGLVTPTPATWFERTFRGPRHHVALGFNDVGPAAVFAVYFAERERVLRLAHPAQLLLRFAGADRLGIDAISPQAGRRELARARDGAEVVSLFLDRLEGVTPQVLRVQFGYLSGLQSWGPVLVPVLFFVLGNLAGVFLRNLGERVGRRLATHLQVGRRQAGQSGRERGVILARERLGEIVPGETTHDEVLRLCGPPAEEREDLAAPSRTTLVYRGRREVPHRRWTVGWLATVSHWDVEHHEVEIALEAGRVRDVATRVRRTRLGPPDGLPG